MKIQQINLVPMPATRAALRQMLRSARELSGEDIIAAFAQCAPEQRPALVVLLAKTASNSRPLDRHDWVPNMPRGSDPILSETQRHEAWKAYRRGDRDAWAITGWREYERLRKRAVYRSRPAADESGAA